MDATSEDKFPAFFPLSSRERRVLGVLIEKGLTTPEYYPLTLKALTAGCNQKSNRAPVVNYDEETVEDTIESLREKKLVATVHTESGRTERFRHYVRHRFEITEPQIAVLAELLLRGRQQLGELRSRANRMVPIESLDILREAVTGLIAMQGAQASGDLNRRGIEVDHALYTDAEHTRDPEKRMTADPEVEDDLPTATEPTAPPPTAAPAPPPVDDGRLAALDRAQAELREENRALRDEIDTLNDALRALREDFESFKSDLGG